MVPAGSLGLNGSTPTGGAIAVNTGTLNVNGGSVGAASLAVGGHNTSGTFDLSSGSVAVTGNITTSDNDSSSIQITGGTLTPGGIVEARTGIGPTPGATGIPSPAVSTAIYVNGSSATVNIGSNGLTIGTSNSSASFREDLGTVTVSGPTTIGDETAANPAVRWNYLNVNGGSFTSTNSGGIEIAKNGVNGATTNGMDADLYITGGVVTSPEVAFGNRQTQWRITPT